MRRVHIWLAAPAALALSLGAAAPALAHGEHVAAAGDTSEGEPGDYSITLGALNDSGAGGSAVITLAENGDLTVNIEATGLVPNQPHAQHIHGASDRQQDFVCPTGDADADGDGIVSTAEGLPSYGDIFISLTTEGDSSPDSGLAVDRMPVADADGNVAYTRTFTADELPDGTAAAVRNLHVVQHGIDVNGNGEYDAEAGPSELDPALPQEATAPASCGMIEGSNISDIPDGGVDTGSGPLASSAGHGGNGTAVLAFSGVVLAALAGLTGHGLRRRRAATR
ncbi:hypothetical protein [Jiangella mangrovi]|uniref:CHRD domain-containing protein n=1 Tax=Jiangella mangrovi TaxID=1524084 RepID=A0A7W9LNQ1_9ACTN|nr:hypothetical protein [Jiangella mangrovi]MBB5790362.1 hypothetical protein [Jiangella mangrovi]